MYRVIIERRKDKWAVALYRENRKVWSHVGSSLGPMLEELRSIVEEFGRMGQ